MAKWNELTVSEKRIVSNFNGFIQINVVHYNQRAFACERKTFTVKWMFPVSWFGLTQPPSSSETFFRFDLAAFSAINRPTSVDPVNATFRTSRCVTSAWPAVSPKPGTTLITPSGNPACLESAAAYNALNGVCSAGFNTIVHPAAKAGAHFHDTYWKSIGHSDHILWWIKLQAITINNG